MKSRNNYLSIGAGALALFALSACQNQEIPTESTHVENGPALQAPVDHLMPEGRKATDEEVARFLATRKDAPAVELPDGPAQLAKAAALPTCAINFNTIWGLDQMLDEAYTTYAGSPFYTQPCNGNYFAFSQPQNSNQYRLIPEATGWCVGSPYKIGKWINGSCQQQNSGSYWPRFAGNIGGNTGVRFFVRNQFNTLKNFDLQAIYIRYGTAEVVAYRPGIGWWVWYPLGEGKRWYWPAGNVVSEIQVYSHGRNGTIHFDNIEIGINP